MQKELICPQCQKPAIGGEVHPLCKKSWGMDGLWTLGSFTPPLEQAIYLLKYEFVKKVAEILIEIMLEYWGRYHPLVIDNIARERGENWCVTAVPLHSKRQNWRGFNQSALLGGILARKIGIPYADCIKKTRHTSAQVGLDSEKRRKNVKDAFQVMKNIEVREKNILLIDDVWTTGSTMKECAKVLKKAGAKTIWGITIAR